jgi:hypothetical protein
MCTARLHPVLLCCGGQAAHDGAKILRRPTYTCGKKITMSAFTNRQSEVNWPTVYERERSIDRMVHDDCDSAVYQQQHMRMLKVG